MQKISTEDKLKMAALMINEGKVDSLESLYTYLPKRVVAQILGVNSVRFSNIKSNQPGEFRLEELVKLSKALNINLNTVVGIFEKSFYNRRTAIA